MILDVLYNRYKSKNINEVVFRLSYAGKFIIIKGKSMAGALYILQDEYIKYYRNPDRDRYKDHLYAKLFKHIKENKGSPRIRILARKWGKKGHYEILKREQMELDKNQGNDQLLNRYNEAYIPKYNSTSGMYGWLESEAVKQYQGYMISKRRTQYLERYKFKK